MPNDDVSSPWKRLAISLGSMFLIIAVLVAAILLFVSFGPGPSWPRGITGVVLSAAVLYGAWKSMGETKEVAAAWIGIFSGMAAWMVIGEISHQFGFVVIEDEGGLVLLLFLTIMTAMLWRRNLLPWGFRVLAASFLLNWWGHAVLLPQMHLAETLDAPFLLVTYTITGAACLAAFAGLLLRIGLKPATKGRLAYFGLWLYVLLVTGIEGVTNITTNTFGH